MTHCATVTTAITYGILIMIFVFWEEGTNVTSQRINHSKNADNAMSYYKYSTSKSISELKKKSWKVNVVLKLKLDPC